MLWDCFEQLPALVKIDAPQFNLIIATCAVPHLLGAKDFCVSAHGHDAFERQPLWNLPCSAVGNGRLLSDPVGEIPSV